MMPATAISLEQSSTDAEISVETVSDYDSFLALAPDWDRLVEAAGIDHPFLAHGWFRAWWDAFGAGKELHILVVRKGAEAIGIAPLMLAPARIYGLKMRRLQSIHNDHSPRFDFIVGNSAKDVYNAIWSYLAKRRRLWDVLQVSQLETVSPTFDHLRRMALADGFPVGTWPSDRSPYVDLSQGWDAYLTRLSTQHKKKIRQHIRQLEHLGRVELEIVVAAENLETALEDGFRLEAAGWKSETGTAIRCRPELVEFYSRLALAAARAGTLRLIFLTVGGARIAFAYALEYKNKLFVLKAGYHPEYAAYSPYNVLCYLVFRDACERGLVGYEFLGVDDSWKLRWTKTTKAHCWLYVFGETLRPRLLHWLKFQLAPKIKHSWPAVFLWS
jgi:CelD/BcsL family acetyltransferase involved in cellulose biosynthesis